MTEQQTTAGGLADELKNFLNAYKDRDGNYKYFDKINNMMASNSLSLTIDYIDFDTFVPDLAKRITHEPDDMLEAFNQAVESILADIHPDYAQEVKDKVKVRIGNYTVQKGLRDINAEVINKLIGVSGMVVRSSEVKPLAKKIGYVCNNCGTITEGKLKGLVLKKPQKCQNCSEKELEMSPEGSVFTDFQMVRLQELPEDLPAGQLPHYVEVTVMGDLVDQCRPGDRVMLTGVVRIEQEQVTPQIKTSLFRLRMEGNNIEYLGGRAGKKDTRTIERIAISNEDEKQILAIAAKSDAYEKLIASYAPHVYGHEVIKEAILLLIVGSITKKLEDGSTRRGDINVLLIGDPGCLVGQTRVILGDGSIVRLDSLGHDHLDNINTTIQTEYGTDMARVFHRYKDASIIEILTDTGKRIRGTYNHPLMTDKGWKRLDMLNINDRLKSVSFIPCSISKHASIIKSRQDGSSILITVSEDIASLAGYLSANKDGYFSNLSDNLDDIKSAVNNMMLDADTIPEIRTELRAIADRLDKAIYESKIRTGEYYSHTVPQQQLVYKQNKGNTIENSEIVSILLANFRNGQSVPEFILTSPNRIVSIYLRWLFQSAAILEGKNSFLDFPSIKIQSQSLEFLEDIQLLLLRFKVKSKILINENSNPNFLVISDMMAINYFKRNINFISADKIMHLDFLSKLKVLDTTLDNNYEKIVKIIYHLRREDVFDIEVPRSHRFIANGIISHNTAKSEMLKFAAKIAPRGLYTSGRGSTAAGLTAAVIRDKSGIMMLEAGAVVLGDQGLVCIDEFDKIKAEDRSALHEVMEQQTCSVAKGGIVATLNARTSILSAANPMYGKYDPFKNITENVNLPIPLLTRFDLVYVIRDTPEKEKDSRVASHILEIHRDTEHAAKPAIDIDLFSKYLAFSKQTDPQLTTEAIEIIKEYYMKMRNVDSEGMITVTPRQLEGLVRLSTARARLLLKDRVEAEDAERAIYLVQRMLETAGVDVNTGRVDLGVLHGKPHSEVSKLKVFMEVFKALSGDGKNDVEEKNFVNELAKTGKFTEEDARGFIKKAMQNGQIYERKTGFYAKA